jgi:hypothetical protein
MEKKVAIWVLEKNNIEYSKFGKAIQEIFVGLSYLGNWLGKIHLIKKFTKLLEKII